MKTKNINIAHIIIILVYASLMAVSTYLTVLYDPYNKMTKLLMYGIGIILCTVINLIFFEEDFILEEESEYIIGAGKDYPTWAAAFADLGDLSKNQVFTQYSSTEKDGKTSIRISGED